jgi:hypothetical protein
MPDKEIKELQDVAFRKIGRNLVNFQQLERLLKLIIVRSDVQGCASELAKILRDKDKNIDCKTLGLLVRDFFQSVYSNRLSYDGSLNDVDDVWVSICVTVKSNSIEHQERQLRELVKERNLLVHGLLAHFDLDSVENCEKLIHLLDDQVDRLEPQYQSLMDIIGSMKVVQQEVLKQLDEWRESAQEDVV